MSELIFVVDDTEDTRYALSRLLRSKGYEVEEFSSGSEVFEKAKLRSPSLILLDVMMPIVDGYQVTRQLKADSALRFIPVILVTAKDSLEDIVTGFDHGADDYIIKPFKADEVVARIKASLRLRKLYLELRDVKEENVALQSQLAAKGGEIIGNSPAISRVLELIDKIAPANAPVLITGPSGTGKELTARAIHQHSARANRPFIARNCAAFNENLMESELFGHVKGAFTGAMRDHRGVFEVADGGTLFLDEIGEMSPSLQAKILRVLQEGTFQPVGATSERRIDVRVLAATHRDLEQMVAEGKFREDLFYRLNVLNIELPPLKERSEDISSLIEHFLREIDQTHRKSLSAESERILAQYSWPGNIRELRNEVERMVILSGEEDVITPNFLSERITKQGVARGVTTGLKQILERVERQAIEQALARANGNRSQAAKDLAISRSSLIAKIQQYGIS